jgi:hypothetical protein
VIILLAAGWLVAGALHGTTAPTPAIFTGQVTVTAAGTAPLAEEMERACRQLPERATLFAALAFPAAQRIRSGCGRRPAGSSVSVTVDGSGRIHLGSGHNEGLNFECAAGTPADAWGVLLVLLCREDGVCRVGDVQVLAPDRQYDLGSGRLLWLGAADEDQALACLNSLSAGLCSGRAREALVFPLYALRGTGTVSALIDLARRDPETDIRKQAIFWLGQRASSAAVKALGDVIASPEALEVKKHAVFALSQLDGDRGTPLLLEIARKNPHPALRKTAIFWLGESGDPRALEFFEEVLLK